MSILSQRSLAGGELAPALYPRTDLAKFQSGLRTLRNCFIMRTGGVLNRPGTQFVDEMKSQTVGENVRLVPFKISSQLTYVIEFTDQCIRIIRDGEYVCEATKNVLSVSQANPCVVVTTTNHGYTSGQAVILESVGGMTELNGRQFKVAVLSSSSFSLKYMDGTAVNSSTFAAFTSGGTVKKVYEVVVGFGTQPFEHEDLPYLQYQQNLTTMYLTVPDDLVNWKLVYTSELSWAISPLSPTPGISAVTGLTNDGPADTGGTEAYIVTAVSASGEESLTTRTRTNKVASSASPPTSYLNITWDGVADAVEYRVYRYIKGTGNISTDGVFGYVGTVREVGTGTITFIDTGYTPDALNNPPRNTIDDFYDGQSANALGWFQQRLLLGGGLYSDTVVGSQTGFPTNFCRSYPLVDSDSVNFLVRGEQFHSVRHLVDSGRLFTLTDAGEWICEGSEAGILTPSTLNPRQFDYNGSSFVRPVKLQGHVLFVQALGSLLLDIQADNQSVDDLTVFSSHLVDGYTLLDMAYQRTPHSVVWIVRSDGSVIAVTYNKKQEVFGWHRHDFGNPNGTGEVKAVCVVTENQQEVLYVAIERQNRDFGSGTETGRMRRVVERFTNRQVSDVKDYVLLDSAISYDGRNETSAHTMTLSGSGWTETDTLTLTSSTAFFASSDVGNEIQLTGSDGTLVRARITAYTSTTVVSVKPNKTVPAAMRAVAISDWAKAVDELSGLWHLEGYDVSIFADGFVVASPNNPAYPTYTVTNGAITLDRPYAVIHVGLPFISDVETLDVDTAGTTLQGPKKKMDRLGLQLEKTRGLWVGTHPGDDSLDGLVEPKVRSREGYDSPVDLKTDYLEVALRPEWNSNGRVLIRQVDPLPMSVLAIHPDGWIARRG